MAVAHLVNGDRTGNIGINIAGLGIKLERIVLSNMINTGFGRLGPIIGDLHVLIYKLHNDAENFAEV
jgi:hypothetical protein